MCARGVCATWRPFKVKRRKRTAEQHELNTGNALYNTLPAHMRWPDSARVCVCVWVVCVACLCVCVMCVCVMCVWRVCGMAANVKNQTTASPAKPTANQNVQPAAKSTAAGGGRASWGGVWHKGATVRPGQEVKGKGGNRSQATAAKRPRSWAIGQPKNRC